MWTDQDRGDDPLTSRVGSPASISCRNPERADPMWRKAAIFTAVLMFFGTAAHGRPPHKKAMADYFGPRLAPKLNDCRTCHIADELDDPETKPHNPFGKRLKLVRKSLRKAGKKASIPERLDAVAEEDSDGDGAVNVLELLTGHNPGEADDIPTLAELETGRKALAEFLASKGSKNWDPYEPVSRPKVPQSDGQSPGRNPIDAFLAADLAQRHLIPRPEAPRAILLRRVFLDLIGLPPTLEEQQAYRNDASDDAYERVVDRLLADPRHGERWGRHWMDVWRYSDWAGYQAQVRDSQPHIWRWRDWIIESINRDQGYDRMVLEMLAADEAAPEDRDALRATGYLVRNYKLLSREKWMQDVVDHTTQAFLGVTLGCARCHDHMYDPLLQKEYYQVRAVFEPHNVRIDRVAGQSDVAKDGLARAFDADPAAKTFLFVRGDDRNPGKDPLAPGVPEALGGTFPPITPVPLPRSAYAPDSRATVRATLLDDSRKAVTATRSAREALDVRLALALVGVLPTAKGLDTYYAALMDSKIAEARQQALEPLFRAEALEESGRKDSDAWRTAATETTAAQRRLAALEAGKAELLARQGRRATPPTKRAEADKAAADALKALARADATEALAPSTAFTPRAITSYPTTSTGRRLAFARWIASNDNPLTARVAVNHVWLRHFGRAIVPTVNDFGHNGQGPSNPALLDWLAAEFMDQGWSLKSLHRLIVTSAAYRRDSTPDPAGLATDPDNIYQWRFSPRRLEAETVRDEVLAVSGQLDPTMGGPEIDHNQGLTIARRSVYFRHAAEKQMEFLSIFDGPSVTECYQRKPSILPQQALALVNSDLTLRAARLLAGSLSARTGLDQDSFIASAFQAVLARSPTLAEQAACRPFLNQATPTPASTDPMLRAREHLVHVLLNHHEFVTIR
ncbi:MAG: DUF1549 and DUF1553 domain-containing protein [Isosphaeraceae bacterium]